MAHKDSIEWSRERWAKAGEPAPDHFAAMAGVLRLSNLIGAGVDRVLKGHDLSRSGYLVLATLYISRDKTLTMTALARSLMLHPTTISLVVDQLQGRGFVNRDQHPTDRRTVLASLTKVGTKALREANVSLAEAGYGLGETSDRLAITLTEIVRQVRSGLGDNGDEEKGADG